MTENSTPTPGTHAPTPGTHAPTPGAMPRKAATPGPRPGNPSPAVTATPATTPSPVPTSDPSKFGRIAEDGTVYLTYKGTEKVIGSWQAGTPEEGLAHYAQRFDDLAADVALLETRLVAHPEDANSIKKQAQALLESLDEQAVIGDLAAVGTRLTTVIADTDKAREAANEAKAQRRAEAIARKEALAAEAEDLAENSTQWKQAGDRIRAILDEWRTIRGIDHATDDELWKRYSRARDAFSRRRGAHFAEMDRNRSAAKKTKEELIARAEALQDSTDWKETARAYRDLMTEWKAAGRAPREVDEQLWQRFRAAQDHFFNAREAVNAERDREYAANAEAKNALLAEYDSQIDPSRDLGGAKQKLRELQDKWDEIGYVPRNKVREYEDKIAALEKRVADAEDSRWRASDPAAQEKVHQFQVKADEFRAQAEAAEEKGNAKKAEELRAQAAQWQEFADVAAKAVSGN